MTERQEEQAALHALHLLDAHETRIQQSEMRTDPRLREIVPEFADAAAQIALLLPEEPPPEDCRRRVLGEIRRRRRANVKVITTPLRIIFGPWVAWAAAACIALVAFRYREAKHQLADQVKTLAAGEAAAKSAEAQEKSRVAGLEKQITDSQTKFTSLTGEVDRLQKVNALARMEVAQLKTTLKRFDEGVAVVVWDSEKQEGKLRLDKMPPITPAKDYQLWVIDKKKPAPVNAGVVRVDPRGSVVFTFKPVEPVTDVAKFALSIEKQGGVDQKSADGPVIFVGP